MMMYCGPVTFFVHGSLLACICLAWIAAANAAVSPDGMGNDAWLKDDDVWIEVILPQLDSKDLVNLAETSKFFAQQVSRYFKECPLKWRQAFASIEGRPSYERLHYFSLFWEIFDSQGNVLGNLTSSTAFEEKTAAYLDKFAFLYDASQKIEEVAKKVERDRLPCELADAFNIMTNLRKATLACKKQLHQHPMLLRKLSSLVDETMHSTERHYGRQTVLYGILLIMLAFIFSPLVFESMDLHVYGLSLLLYVAYLLIRWPLYWTMSKDIVEARLQDFLVKFSNRQRRPTCLPTLPVLPAIEGYAQSFMWPCVSCGSYLILTHFGIQRLAWSLLAFGLAELLWYKLHHSYKAFQQLRDYRKRILYYRSR